VKVAFRESFARDLAGVADERLRQRIKAAIEQVERARTMADVSHLKRLEAKGKYYRIRVGDYRLGLVLEGGAFVFVRALNRKEIYRYFP